MKSPIQKVSKTQDSGSNRKSVNKTFLENEKKHRFFENRKTTFDDNFFQARQESGNKQNKTGLPDKLKNGVENLSGIDMSDVKVHRNSSRPKQLDALAYTQGTDIFLGPGQEKHLPHEAWHVVQQKQGRVDATEKLGKDDINSDISLEKEATSMGNKALSNNSFSEDFQPLNSGIQSKNIQKKAVVQREPIPSSAIVLDVSAASEDVLQNLIATARGTSRQYSSVNWRNMFLGVIHQQIAGRALGTITGAWRDNAGIDVDWTVTMNFDMTGATRTERETETRDVTNTSGGTSSNSLGSSQSNTTGTSVSATGGSSSSVGAEAGPVSAEQGSSRSGTVGFTDSNTTGSTASSGGGLSTGSSSASSESINRYIANLRVTINCTAEAAYSNWDIINPVKWGSHLAGRQDNTRTFVIGTITYDLPNY